MCGASLTEEDAPEKADEGRRGLPNWVGSVAAVLLALLILGAGGFGLYTMLAVEPEPEPTALPVTPSPTVTREPTSTPTRTPSPTPTSTPLPPRAHDVGEGETLSDIAERYDVTMNEILALNPELDPEVIKPGQVLLIPAAQPSGEDAGSADFLIHVVRSGETLSLIAEEYDISVSVLRAANDIDSGDETIRPDQSLVIPVNTPVPSPTPTPAADLTPTPEQPYDSPPLLQPADGAVVKDGEPVLLQWASVSVLQPNEWYELRLWQPGGGVVSGTIRTRTTAWRVPVDLLERADDDAPRVRWLVRVVRESGADGYEQAGFASPAKSFVWQRAAATAVPSPTPTP